MNSAQPEEAIQFPNDTTSYSVNASFRFNNTNRSDLLTLSGENNKIKAFVNPTENKVGLNINGADYEIATRNGVLSTTKWRSIAYVLDREDNKVKVYLEKELIGEVAASVEVTGLNKVRIGSSDTQFDGSIERLHVYGQALDEVAVNALHAVTEYNFEKIVDPTQSHISETTRLFQDGYANARKYRIPSLLTTKEGTVLVAIDQRHQHAADWGNIDAFLRRSTDGGKNWDTGKRVIDLVDNEAAGLAHSAFLIDPSMVQDKESGRIFMLIDMFTDNHVGNSRDGYRGGFFGLGASDSGYTEVEGKKYLTLFDQSRNVYTIRENGKVYDSNNRVTEYTVPDNANFENAFKDLGTLYKSGEKVGNIYQMSYH